MYINLQVWDSFLGQSLIVFLIIEGLKTFPWIARVSRGSILLKLLLNVAVNLAFCILLRGTGTEMIWGEGPLPLVLSTLVGSLTTAGLWRLKKAFERRSPHAHWEARHGPSATPSGSDD